jgi:CRP-like cAMP-binding protein
MTDQTGKQPSETRFLADWTEQEWEVLLGYSESRSFMTGDTVISVGEEDRAFYIVASGKLDITIYSEQSPDPVLVQSCAPGSMFGEQAFLDGKPRSATVRASVGGRLARFSFEAFEAFYRDHPELGKRLLFDLARLLSLRLRRANSMLGGKSL